MNAVMSLKEYRDQIRRYARGMAVAKNDGVASDLAPGMTREMVEMFTEGNIEKRKEKLQDVCDFMGDGFEGLDELIHEYVHEIPLAAYDTGMSDAQHFVDWLTERVDLTDEQRDLMTCLSSRSAVEMIAVKNRLSHVRFQELLATNRSGSRKVSKSLKESYLINPIRVWATFNTRILLDEMANLPSTVVFFPVESDIRTAVIEPEAEVLVRQLEAHGTCQLRELMAGRTPAERSEVVSVLSSLCVVGLVAVV